MSLSLSLYAERDSLRAFSEPNNTQIRSRNNINNRSASSKADALGESQPVCSATVFIIIFYLFIGNCRPSTRRLFAIVSIKGRGGMYVLAVGGATV